MIAGNRPQHVKLINRRWKGHLNRNNNAIINLTELFNYTRIKFSGGAVVSGTALDCQFGGPGSNPGRTTGNFRDRDPRYRVHVLFLAPTLKYLPPASNDIVSILFYALLRKIEIEKDNWKSPSQSQLNARQHLSILFTSYRRQSFAYQNE